MIGVGYGGGFGRGSGKGYMWGRRASSMVSKVKVPPPKEGVWRFAAPTLDPNGLDAVISPHFARAPYIVLTDIVNGSVVNVEVINNPAFSSGGGGAGSVISQLLLNAGVRAVAAVYIGPNLATRLQQLGIAVYPAQPWMRVRDVIRSLGLAGT